MADPLAMVALINRHKGDLEQALGSRAPGFFTHLAEIHVRALGSRGDPAAQEEIMADLLALLEEYAAAGRIMHRLAPGRFPAPPDAGEEPGTGSAAESAPPDFSFLPGDRSHPIRAAILPDRPGPAAHTRDLGPLARSTALPVPPPTGGGPPAEADPAAVTPASPESLPVAAAQAVPRYADVRAPAAVAPDQSFAVSVGLTQQAPEGAAHASPLRTLVTDTAAGPTGAPPLTVLLYTAAFEVVGSSTATLHVYADRDSDPATFELRPKAGTTGAQQISLTFVQGGINILGRVVATVQVGTPVAMMHSYSLPMGLSDARAGQPNPLDPDVILWIDLVQGDRDFLHFQYSWPQQNQRDWVDVQPFVPLNRVEDFARNLYEQLSACAAYAPPAGGPDDPGVQASIQAAERTLRKIGANLYDQLFPPALKTFYRQFAPTARTILIHSAEPWIPWEIVLPSAPDLPDDECEFLCARFQVTRWLIGQDVSAPVSGVPSTVRVHQICPVIPPVGLAAVQDESTYLRGLPQTWPPLELYAPAPRTAPDVLAAMQKGTVNLFHIATHGQFNVDDPNAAAIQFSADGSQLTPEDIFERPVLQGLARAAPLVFINACHSSRQGLALTGIGGWVDKLLRNGCSGFIGSNWEVQDELAARFSIAFYQGLRQGRTFGEACQAARAQIRAANRGNSTWLAYVLYAHPRGILQAVPAPIADTN